MTNDIDLNGMTVQQLTALIEKAETRRREKLEEEKAAFIAEMREKAAQLGLSLDTLFSSRGKKARKEGGSAAVKFRGPNGEEWTGRGRLPTWLSALEAQGRKRDEFRI